MEERLFSDLSYERILNEGKLMGSKCRECDVLFLPPGLSVSSVMAQICSGSRWRGKGISAHLHVSLWDLPL